MRSALALSVFMLLVVIAVFFFVPPYPQRRPGRNVPRAPRLLRRGAADGIRFAGFHLAPDNHTLFWDRLPMTIAFMPFFAIIAGDLRSYGLVQFLPLLRIPAIMLTHRSVFDRTGFIWLTSLLHVLAKACELLDAAIYDAGQRISGHSIKHALAAAGPRVLIYGGIKRRLRDIGE